MRGAETAVRTSTHFVGAVLQPHMQHEGPVAIGPPPGCLQTQNTLYIVQLRQSLVVNQPYRPNSPQNLRGWFVREGGCRLRRGGGGLTPMPKGQGRRPVSGPALCPLSADLTGRKRQKLGRLHLKCVRKLSQNL